MTMNIPSLNRPVYPTPSTNAKNVPYDPNLIISVASLCRYTQQAAEHAKQLQTLAHVDQNMLQMAVMQANVLVTLLNMTVTHSTQTHSSGPEAKPTALDVTLKAREAVDNLFRGKSEEKLLEIRQITDTVLSTLRKEGIV